MGLVFGLSLMLLNEALTFAGTLLGLQFSFSLVNLLDPNSMIETAVLGQMLSWLGVLVIIGSGLDQKSAGRGGAEFFCSSSRAGSDAGEDRCGAGDDGERNISGGVATGSSCDGGGTGGGGDDCAGGAVVATAAGDGGEHTAEDDGVVCGFDRKPGGVAGVDRATLYGVAGCRSKDVGAGMSDAAMEEAERAADLMDRVYGWLFANGVG